MNFPDPESANSDGLLCVGGTLNVENLTKAYSLGIFPWPQEDFPVLWFSPPQRGIIFLNKFKIPESTQRVIRKNKFSISMNEDFKEVIEKCAISKRKSESGTWILPEMVQAYIDLFNKGLAFSIEARLKGELVGGLYGVHINGFYSGESMFFIKSEASKVCLVYLIEFLKEKNIQWLDIQMVTPLTAQFGGEYIERSQFLKLIKK